MASQQLNGHLLLLVTIRVFLIVTLLFSTCQVIFNFPLEGQEKIYGVNGIWDHVLKQVLEKIYMHLNLLIVKKIVDPIPMVRDIRSNFKMARTR